MRILQLSVHFAPNVGGVETHLSDLVDGLAEKKTRVFVLTYRPLMTKTSWKVLEKKVHLTILRLPWFPGFFYSLVRHPVIEFLYLVPGLFFVTPFVIFFGNCDIVHAHGLVAGFVGLFWSKILGRKIIISTHSIYNFPKSGLYYLFVKWIFQNANTVLCLSDQSIDEISELGVAPNKIKRFTYWINSKTFFPIDKDKAKKKLGLTNEFTVLFIGRLIKEKGVSVLLEASLLLPIDVKIIIIGDGPLQELVEEYSKQSTTIKFYGKVENNKLNDYYNGADVLIVPSINEEGFGRVIIESLSCGTPVIGANKGGIPEAMDSTVGRLINVTPVTIVKEILKMKNDKVLYDKLSTNARIVALKKYSEKNINEIASLYKL